MYQIHLVRNGEVFACYARRYKHSEALYWVGGVNEAIKRAKAGVKVFQVMFGNADCAIVHEE